MRSSAASWYDFPTVDVVDVDVDVGVVVVELLVEWEGRRMANKGERETLLSLERRTGRH